MALILGSTAATVTTPPVYNVKDYGAVGNNVADDTAAIQAAMNALKANVHATTNNMAGQTLYFPPGYYRVTSTLDFSGLAQVRILGGSGKGGWGRLAADANLAATIAIYHGNASTADGVNMKNSTGCVWDGVGIISRSQSYTGILLNFDATAAADVFGNRVQNCVIRGFSGGTLLGLAGNICFSADNVHFQDGPVRMSNASALAKWSNANTFRDCVFSGGRTYSVLNPAAQTTFASCTFEPASGNVPAPIAFTALGNEPASGLTVMGCGFWDNTGTGGAWVTSTVATSGFAFIGGKYDVSPGGTFFSLSSHTGLSVQGVHFQAANGGTPNIFDPSYTITNGSMLGCYVKSPVVDNHASVFA